MSEEMIRRLRRKFVITATVTLTLVMLGISGLIFLSNSLISRRTVHTILEYLADNNGTLMQTEGENGPEGNEDEYTILHFFSEILGRQISIRSPEFFFSTRYFAVLFDESGELSEIKASHIASVDETQAEEYAREALRHRRQFGREGIYYYRIKRLEDGKTIVVFLDSWSQLQSNHRLMYSAMIVIGFVMIVTFLLIWRLSYRAIQPEIENAELQKRFITDASHELKTPLAVIKANTEMEEMLNGQDEWTQSTLRQVDRLSGLIQNLVMISRLQEKEKGSRTDIDVSACIHDTVQTFGTMAAQSGKQLDENVPDGISMRAVESEVRQLCSLLLDNAIKYCDDGGEIRVDLAKKGKGIQLQISNSYAEGKDEETALYFERFYRKDESRNADRGGYGVGLSIAEGIVHQYNGTIGAKWNEGFITFTAVLRA